MWPTAMRRSQNIRIALLADLLNVVDQATIGRAPNITLLTMVILRPVSGSETPAHATNGVLAPKMGRDSQCDFAFCKSSLSFVAKRTIIWIAATPE